MNHFQKSNKKLEKLRGIFFQMGLTVACGLTFLAFEWKTVYTIPDIPFGITIVDDIDDPTDIIYTPPKKVVRPKVKTRALVPDVNKIKIIPDNQLEEILAKEENIEAILDDYDPEDLMEKEDLIELLPVPEKIEDWVDKMPEFVGGEQALLNYLAKNTNYSEVEVLKGNEGIVHVQFVVGKNGKVRDVKIREGVSELLNQEAIRVVNSMPDWIPGKKEGEKVSVRYNLPIHFKLK